MVESVAATQIKGGNDKHRTSKNYFQVLSSGVFTVPKIHGCSMFPFLGKQHLVLNKNFVSALLFSFLQTPQHTGAECIDKNKMQTQ